MGARWSLDMAILLMAVLGFHQLAGSKAQTVHVVGDSLGWTVPNAGAGAYSTWASTQTFTVGSILVFNFPTTVHTVAEVNEAAYGPCTTANPLSLITTGPANITLTSAGQHYYICTVPQHCNFGQKLAINVSAAPSLSPAPSPPVPSAPSPSSATPPPAHAPATPPPVPAPATPPPVPAPAPSPSSATPPPAHAPSPLPSGHSPSPSPGRATPPPSLIATPPSNPTAASSPPPAALVAPPPPNSASSLAMAAALPVTILSLTFAFFY